MDVKQTIEVEITKEELVEIIRAHLSATVLYDFSKADVVFKVADESFCGDEYRAFYGASVTLRK